MAEYTVNVGTGEVTTILDAWLENETGNAVTLCVRTRIHGNATYGPWGYGVEGQSGYDGNGAEWQEVGEGVLNYGDTVVDGIARFGVSKTHTGWTARCWAKMWGKVVNGYGAYPVNDVEVNMTVYIPATTSYTVSYGGTGSGMPDSQTKWHGEALTLSNTKPTRSGYSFLGWSTNNSSTVAYASGAQYTADSDITLYAVWQQNSWTVSYNANGGSGAPASQTKVYGTALTLSTTKPTRTGYTFKGWATSSGGSVAYAPGASYTNNATLTLYAVWQINTYTVSYSANGGSGAPASQTKTYGVSLTLSSTKPTRTGYTFAGWEYTLDGAATLVQPGATYTTNASVTLSAVWKINTYTISYNVNGGTGAPASQTKTYGKDLTLSTTVPTLYRHTFLGWATSKANADNQIAAYGAGGTYTTNASITLYATWRLSYIEPTISSMTVTRCLANGTADVNGTYARVTCKWAVDTSADSDNKAQTVNIDYIATNVANPTSSSWTNAYTSPTQAVTGSVNTIIGGGNLSVSKSYYIRVSVIDTGSGASRQSVIYPPFRTFDAGLYGKSVAIGKPASDDTSMFECAIPAQFDNVTCDNLYFNLNNTPTQVGGFITSQGSTTNTDSSSRSWSWWYRKYNNGTVEMWGRVAGSALTSGQCTFPITLKNTSARVFVSAVPSGSTVAGDINPAVVTTTGCYIATSSNISGAIHVYVEGTA